MTRINFSAWGYNEEIKIPAYCNQKEKVSKVRTVAEAIARKNGLSICGGPKSEGIALNEEGKPYAYHYSMTLGKPIDNRTYSVVSCVWFSIPIQD